MTEYTESDFQTRLEEAKARVRKAIHEAPQGGSSFGEPYYPTPPLGKFHDGTPFHKGDIMVATGGSGENFIHGPAEILGEYGDGRILFRMADGRRFLAKPTEIASKPNQFQPAPPDMVKHYHEMTAARAAQKNGQAAPAPSQQQAAAPVQAAAKNKPRSGITMNTPFRVKTDKEEFEGTLADWDQKKGTYTFRTADGKTKKVTNAELKDMQPVTPAQAAPQAQQQATPQEAPQAAPSAPQAAPQQPQAQQQAKPQAAAPRDPNAGLASEQVRRERAAKGPWYADGKPILPMDYMMVRFGTDDNATDQAVRVNKVDDNGTVHATGQNGDQYQFEADDIADSPNDFRKATDDEVEGYFNKAKRGPRKTGASARPQTGGNGNTGSPGDGGGKGGGDGGGGSGGGAQPPADDSLARVSTVYKVTQNPSDGYFYASQGREINGQYQELGRERLSAMDAKDLLNRYGTNAGRAKAKEIDAGLIGNAYVGAKKGLRSAGGTVAGAVGRGVGNAYRAAKKGLFGESYTLNLPDGYDFTKLLAECACQDKPVAVDPDTMEKTGPVTKIRKKRKVKSS